MKKVDWKLKVKSADAKFRYTQSCTLSRPRRGKKNTPVRSSLPLIRVEAILDIHRLGVLDDAKAPVVAKELSGRVGRSDGVLEGAWALRVCLDVAHEALVSEALIQRLIASGP